MTFNVEYKGRKFTITLKEHGDVFYDENDWPSDERAYTYEVFDEKEMAYYSIAEPYESWAEAGSMAMNCIVETLLDKSASSTP